MPPSSPYLALREQCQGFEGNTRSLAAGALNALALLLPLLGTLKRTGYPPGPVTAAALLYPALLGSPVAAAPLLCPCGQYPLRVELRLALVLEGPLHHRQNFLDGLPEEDLPSDLGLDQQQASHLVAKVRPGEDRADGGRCRTGYTSFVHKTLQIGR